MKIKHSTSAVEFQDTDPGSVFQWGDKLYMRLPVDAVDLLNGCLEPFHDGTSVTPKPNAILLPDGEKS